MTKRELKLGIFRAHVMLIKMTTFHCTYIWTHRFVHWTPPNIFLGSFFLDNTFVQRRPTCFCPRVCCQCPCRGHCRTSFVDQSIFVEGRDGRIGNLKTVSKEHSSKDDSVIQWPHDHNQCAQSREVLPPVRYAPEKVCPQSELYFSPTLRTFRTYSTPPGCRAVLLTELETIVA